VGGPRFSDDGLVARIAIVALTLLAGAAAAGPAHGAPRADGATKTQADRHGMLVIFNAWLADCESCAPAAPVFGVDLLAERSSGGLRSLSRLQRRLGDGFETTSRNSALFHAPALSSDGDWIAYVSRDRRVVARHIDLDRQSPIGPRYPLARLRRGDDVTGIAWSPGATSVALAGRLSGTEGVWTVRRDGTGYRRALCGCDPRLAPPEAKVTGIAWAPGPRLGVLTHARSTGAAAVYSLAAAGTGLRRLTQSELGDVSDPVWSPAGRELVLDQSHGSTDADVDLLAVDARSGSLSKLALNASDAAWSPGGQSMAFIRETLDVWVKPTGGGRKRPVRTSAIEEYGWLDDLAWIDRPPLTR
jgi:hypothetical protein